MAAIRFFHVGPVALGALLLLPAIGQSESNKNRYPYDPVCAWGRVADGRGMLERCITKTEAAGLLSGTSKPSGAGAGGKAGTAKPDAGADAGKDPEKKPLSEADFKVRLENLKVKSGQLPKAIKSLSKANKRYRQCVAKHDGLTRKSGWVKVQFLVRGRGRAEGVEVLGKRSLSSKAARCVADVIDRRFVGHPADEFTGATLVVKFSKVKR